MRRADVVTITRFELRRMLVSAPGVLFLVFFSCFYLWLGIKMAGWREQLALLDDVSLLFAGEGHPLVAMLVWATKLPPETLAELFQTHPPVMLLVFAMTLMLVPGMTLVLGMDQTASEIQTKHVRYLLMRTDRTSLYVGKSLSVFVVWIAAMTVGTLVLTAVVLIADLAGTAGTGAVLAYSVRIWLTGIVFGLPFVALAGLAAALTGHPFIASVVTFGSWIFIWLASSLMSSLSEHFDKLAYAFPTALKFRLMSDSTGDIALALTHQLGLAVVFFAAGLTLFRRRAV